MPTPVIQASRSASAIGGCPDLQSDPGCKSHICLFISALGKSRTRNVSDASQTCSAIVPDFRRDDRVAGPFVLQVGLDRQISPGLTKVRSFASFTAASNGMRSKRLSATTSQPAVCAIASISSTPGINGMPGKWPSKIVLFSGTFASLRSCGRRG